jgi:hypothetical protein
MNVDSLRRGFASPPREFGPWAYGITWDNAITAKELLREPEVLLDSPWGASNSKATTSKSVRSGLWFRLAREDSLNHLRAGRDTNSDDRSGQTVR